MYRIGFISVHGDSENHSQMMRGVFDGAAGQPVQVIRFSANIFAERFDTPNTEIQQLLQIIEKQNLDGLLFLGWMPGLTGPFFTHFESQFSYLPRVSLGREYESIPSVCADPDDAVAELVEHLICVHGHRRIAYVPPALADNRLNIYRSVLQKHGLYDPGLVLSEQIMQQGAYTDRMERVVGFLLDPANEPVDAIIIMFESDAENLLLELKKHEVRVPSDLAVISFEDTEFGTYSLPPLTAISFPWYDVGYHGCQKLLQILAGGNPPAVSHVKARLVVRNSCGCGVGRSALPDAFTRPQSPDPVLSPAEKWQFLEQDLQQTAGSLKLDFGAWIRSLAYDLDHDGSNLVFQTFSRDLEEQIIQYPYLDRIEQMENLVLRLRRQVFALFSDLPACLNRFESNLIQMLTAIKEKTVFVIGYRHAQTKSIHQTLHYISQNLVHTYDLDRLFDVLAADLKQLRVPSCYIMLRTEQSPGGYTLAFHYEDGQRLKSEAHATGPQYLAEILLPRHTQLLCQLLYVDGTCYGLVAYQPFLPDLRIYQSLSIHISSAVKNVLLMIELRQEMALREQKERQLIHYAGYDALTDLLNRRSFNRILASLVEENTAGPAEKADFHLVFIDFDDFKGVNDTYGHDVGDLLIQAIARRLKNCLREHPLYIPPDLIQGVSNGHLEAVFRLGGDEFTAIFPRVSQSEMQHLADQMLEKISRPYQLAGHVITISCSIGISCYPNDGDQAEQLLKCADRAMYLAKKVKNTYRFYNQLIITES